jgi:hypothetical protein
MPQTIRFYSSPRHGVKFNAKVTPLLEKKDLYKHEFLSNFEPCDNGVEVHSVYGKTSEHVFQALRWLRAPEGETPEMTTLRREYAQKIAAAKTPSAAYKMAQFVSFRKSDGEAYVSVSFPGQAPLADEIKGFYNRGLRHFRREPLDDFQIMRSVLYAKFRQNPRLMDKLKATGTAKLVEHTARDDRWGDGGDGSGTNWLGKLLVKVRKEATEA